MPDLTDEQWGAIKRLIPVQEKTQTSPKGGRPWRDPRDVLNGVLWVLRTGAPWADLQDGRKLRRYRRRWHVERLFSWMMRFRRLITRFEEVAENFLAFCKLGCIVILLRKL